MIYQIRPYDPCPCGSGEKYKFCCAAKAKDKRHGKFPVGTVAYYGPNDKTTTKIAAGVILREGAEPILQRWVGENVMGDAKIAEQITQFFAKHGVKNVVVTDGNLGCPHEEGIDYPDGQDCPFCPFWAPAPGNAAEIEVVDPDLDDEQEDWDYDASFARVEAILGDDEMDQEQALDKLAAHLKENLSLPCEVTGIEDFQWEEKYVVGGWDPKEYKRLKKTQPSYSDRYELISIERGLVSEWMMFPEDTGARVRRISDGKLFVLGLSELEATDTTSRNYQLLRDYAVWLVNNR